MTVLITRVSSPELFVGSDDDPRQILRVEVDRATTDGGLAVHVSGDGLTGTADLPPGDSSTLLEVPLEVSPALRAQYGQAVDATVTVVGADQQTLASDSGTDGGHGVRCTPPLMRSAAARMCWNVMTTQLRSK